MKLIDLLVQELPGRGGWPEGADYCWQDWDKEIRPVSSGFGFHAGILAENHRAEGGRNPEPGNVNCVTRQQYEAALSASNQVEWSGSGLPPVGSLCEFFNGDRYDCRESVPRDGARVKIVAHDKSEIGTDLAVFTWTGMDGALHAEACIEMLFRPTRTEAERKREGAIDYINMNLDDMNEVLASNVYDLIASGKVPGIKLAD